MNTFFKHGLFLSALCIFSALSQAQNVGINTTGATADASAILDLNTGNTGHLGFLAPQASLISTTDVATIVSPATGLLVYNTNASMTGGNGVGYYYWNGGSWNNANLGGNFIFNQTAVQGGANFNIAQNGVIGGTFNVTGLSTLGAVTSLGIASINASGAGTTTIGNSTNALAENGTITLNASNSAATTSIGTGTTTGNVSIGGASNSVLLPKFTTNNEVLYTNAGNGTIAATPASTGANQVLMTTTAGGAPTFQAMGALNTIKVITNGTTTYTPSATGTSVIQVELIGAGGAGGGTSAPGSNGSAGGGGGAGGYIKFFITNPVGPYTVAVGVGGTGSSGAIGNSGGSTTFNTGVVIYTAGGGSGGAKGNANFGVPGGAGGSATVSSGPMLIGYTGTPGGNGASANTAGGASGQGGSSILGGGGVSVGLTAAGGPITGNAGAANSGSGGSGGIVVGGSAATGGAGANGVIIITEYK